MRAHVDAVKTLLTAGGITSYWVDVPDSPTYPYALLWGPVWGSSAEVPLSGDDTDMDRSLMVTSVAGNPDLVLTFAERVKTILHKSRPPVPDWVSDLRYVRSETADVDRQVTLPNSNRHPAFSVDTYRYRSTKK